jgi:hypothetical protein
MILIFDKNGLSTFRLGCERHRLSEKTHPPRAVRRPARVNGKTHNAKPMPLLITVLLALTALPLALLLLAGVLGLMGAQVCPLGCAWLPAFIQAMLANADSVGLSAVLTSSIADSALLSLSVVTIALLLGAALAWLTSQYDFAGRRAFEVLLITPIALPAYVAAYAWVELLAYDAPLASSFRAVGLLNRLPDIRNAAGAALVLGLSLMPLHSGTRRFCPASSPHGRSRRQPGREPRTSTSPCVLAAGLACAGCGGELGVDGVTGRLRRSQLHGGEHADRDGVQDLVRG